MRIKKLPPGEQKPDSIKMNTQVRKNIDPRRTAWWNAASDKDLQDQVLSAAGYLKTNQQYRIRQASVYSRLYGNIPLFNAIGSSFTRANIQNQLPIDRPTMNVVQSCLDTLVSRVTQAKPRPVFLTDNGDSHMRSLAKQMNQFINGELYQTKAYSKGALCLTDAGILGTGVAQVYEDTLTKRVALDRVLSVDLYVDHNEAIYGNPRQLFRMRLMDRSVLAAHFPKEKKVISNAQEAHPDLTADSSDTIADQVIAVEAWHLPSGKDAGDGRHVIVCSSGILLNEDYTKDRFPFAFLHYSPTIVGFWGQPLTEQLTGTQLEINKLLRTTSKAINLLGVPRVLIENGSKISAGSFNNEIGTQIKYSGTKPEFIVAPCMAPEVYQRIQTLIQYAYQQSGISTLSAGAQKPSGLNSGEALREYDDLQTDRFASLVKRYDDFYMDLAHLMIDQAKDIAIRDGSYQTIYPDKDGANEIDLPNAKLLDNPFVIQCYDTSSLPRDPAGRKEYVVEMMQAGIYSQEEGRRLLNFADTEQVDKLAIAAEERILKYLDDIVEKGKYTPPDEFMDLQLALKLVVQYYNLHEPKNLSKARVGQLIDFKKQVDDLITQMTPPPPPQMMPSGPGAPQAVPLPQPQSSILPVGPH